MKIINFFKKYRLHLIVLIISMLIGGVVAYGAGQDINFDLQNYHYVNPYVFIHHRVNYDIATGELQTFENPLPDVPSYLLINHLSPRQAATAIGLLQGINIWLIFEILVVLFRKLKTNIHFKYGLIFFVAIASFFGAANLSEAGNTMGDNLTGIFVLLAVWLLLYSAAYAKPKGHYNPTIVRLLAYFSAGFAVGLKLTNAIYAIGLIIAGLVLDTGIRQKLKSALLNTAGVITGALVSGGFWYIWMWRLFKNPVFPFYNGIFHSAYYPEVNFVDQRWLAKSLSQALLRPFYFVHRQSTVSEIPFRDIRLAVVYALILIFACLWLANKFILKDRIFKNKLPKEQSMLIVFIVLSYLVWVKQFSYIRYLIPVELLSLSVLSILIFAIVRKLSVASAGIVVLTVLILITTVPISWGRVSWRPTYFGVSKDNFSNVQNSTILVAGYAPTGFLTPYFPASDRTIRVQSDLSSPEKGTVAMQNYIKQAIKDREKQKTPFYAIVADEDRPVASSDLNYFGFRINSCNELPIYTRDNTPDKLRLCSLQELN